MKLLLFLLLIGTFPFLSEAAPLPGSNSTAPLSNSNDGVVWGEMPAGAKTAYIGIHGGTVPVSLLSAGDGSPMVAVVGLTGNDFVNFLRNNGKLQEELILPDDPALLQDVTTLPPVPPLTTSPALPDTVSPATSTPSSAVAQSDPSGVLPADSITAPIPAIPPLGDPAQSTERLPVPGANGTLRVAGTSAGDVPVIYATGSAFDRMSLIPSNWAPFGLTEKALSVEGEVKVLSTPKKSPRKSRRTNKK